MWKNVVISRCQNDCESNDCVLSKNQIKLWISCESIVCEIFYVNSEENSKLVNVFEKNHKLLIYITEQM